MGHSLGGINAYQFAATHPELVQAVIVEDIGVEIQNDIFYGDAPNTQLAFFKECGHGIHDCDVEGFTEEVNKFLDLIIHPK